MIREWSEDIVERYFCTPPPIVGKECYHNSMDFPPNYPTRTQLVHSCKNL